MCRRLPVLLALSACTTPTTSPGASTPAGPAAAPDPTPIEPRRNAILLVIDTLRADAVAKARTPVLDGIAARGDAVDHAWSAGTWTVPSVVSLLTGMPVRQHGWDLGSGKIGRYPIIPDVPTLPGVLHDAGFRTAGLYANVYLDEKLGFARGFDTWTRSGDRSMPRQVAEQVAGWSPDERHFLYVHLLGTHSPLRPSPEAAARHGVHPSFLETTLEIGRAKRGREEGIEEAYRRAYHAVVEDTDALVGEILDALGSHRDDTAIVVTSDHGELLGEHDKFAHGHFVWQPLVHVPLIAEGCGPLPDTLGIASIPDLLTGCVGVHHAWPTGRTDTLPLVAQREGQVALSPDGRFKAIWSDDLRVFDLRVDPEEARRLARVPDAVTAAQVAFESRYPAGQTSLERVALHPDTLEALEALGYVEHEP